MGKTAETRKRIVLSAVKLAGEEGPGAVSVKNICEEAQISKNTFYQYFNNKDEVFGETYMTSDEDKMAVLSQILLKYDSPIEQFWEYCKIDIERQERFGPKLLATIATQNVLRGSFYIEEETKLSPAMEVSLSLIKKMQRCKEIGNMSDPFLLERILYSSAIGIDVRWTKMNGAFDLKREIYNQTMAILQPKKEITNY